jgi:hypothetical protein
MSRSPGKLAASQVVVTADGSPAEAVLDVDGDVFARWCQPGSLGAQPWWTGWQWIAGGAIAIFLAPAARQSQAAYLTVTTGMPAGRTVHLLTAAGMGSDGLGAPCDVRPG